MAKIIGDMKNIREDEKYIVNTLKNYLSENCEVYFKPFLNGEEPDIVVLQKKGGVYLINISKLDVRSIQAVNMKNNRRYLVIKDVKFPVKTPIDKINEQKYNFYNYHIEGLLEEKIRNPKALGIIGAGVVFIKNISKNVNEFFNKQESYVDVYGVDEVRILINNIRRKFTYNGKYFNEKIFLEFQQKLTLPEQKDYSEDELYNLSKKQLELVKSKSGKTKIKGIAGAGKTVVLANRVVNHIKRMKREGKDSKVLILTFNITLRNYIMENIKKICDDESYFNIRISHYHKFVMDEANKYSIAEVNCNNERLFEDIYWLEKYDGIFIDEIQDYKIQWQNLLVNYFLAEDGEYVVFGDEKQNIYDRELEGDRCVRTNIKGGWNKLNRSFRIEGLLEELAISFQRKYLRRYEADEWEISDRNLFGIEQKVKYIQCTPEDLDEVSEVCVDYLNKPYVDIKKSVILSSTVELLRVVEEKIGELNLDINHVITFETEEEYRNLEKNIPQSESSYYEFLKDFKNTYPKAAELCNKCSILNQVIREGIISKRMSHYRRMMLLYNFKFLEDGDKILHCIMEKMSNYSFNITEKNVQKALSYPISCEKMRSYVRDERGKFKCLCVKNEVSTPLEKVDKEGFKNIFIKEDVKKIVDKIMKLKEEKRVLEKNITSLENKLERIFIENDEKEIALDIGKLKKKEEKWIIEMEI